MKRLKKPVSLLVSLLLLAWIYHKIDAARILDVFRQSSPSLLALSLAMVVPLTLATSWRLSLLMPHDSPLGQWDANRLTLMASVLNMVLPSKLGDVAKAAFMAERGHLKGSLALSLVIFEKACDMASLLAWCGFGLLLYPHKDMLFWIMTAAVTGGFALLALLIGSKSFATLFFDTTCRFSPASIARKISTLRDSWGEMHGYFWHDRGRFLLVTSTSLGIWILHLLQIWLFTLALRAHVPFLDAMAVSPLALLAGLLPLTFAGIGTRDAALVHFFAPYMNSADAAALGLLCTMRYVLPAIAGMPFIGGSISGFLGLTRPAGNSDTRESA